MQPCQLEHSISPGSQEPGMVDTEWVIQKQPPPHHWALWGRNLEEIQIRLSISVCRTFVLNSSLLLAYSPKYSELFTWPECPSTASAASELCLDASSQNLHRRGAWTPSLCLFLPQTCALGSLSHLLGKAKRKRKRINKVEVSSHRTDAAVRQESWADLVHMEHLCGHTPSSVTETHPALQHQHFHTLLKAQDFREQWWLITPEPNSSWHVLQRKGSFQTEMKRFYGEEKHILQC